MHAVQRSDHDSALQSFLSGLRLNTSYFSCALWVIKLRSASGLVLR
jgi:hypothetical protein